MVEAKLKRTDALGNLVSWTLVDDAQSATGLADPVVDAGARAHLASLVTAVQGTLNVSLPAAQVTDLKAVTVGNLPATYPLPTTQVTDLKAVTVGNLPADYPLPAAQIADLKAVTVGNLPTDYPLPAAQVADLKTVEVSNFPGAEQDMEERYEFDADGNPLYVGKAPDGTATTAALWTVYKFTFVGGLPTRKQVRENIAWDDRATVVW